MSYLLINRTALLIILRSFYIQLVQWDHDSMVNAMGPAAVQLLAAGLDGHADQAMRVEDLFEKIWPPPNV